MKKNKLILWTLFGLIGFSVIHAQETEQISTEQYNPEYHFYPSGDPTGLYYYDGYYYNNWGVARSKDFVYWKFTDYGKRWNSSRKILANPSVSERKKDSVRQSLTRLGGSGTIIYDKFNSSGLGSKENPPFVSLWHNQTAPWNNQVIGLAYSLDTVKSWQPYEKFPILDINSREFRDPKVFWYEPTQKWIMAIGWADVPKIKF
jgi:levanase